MSRFNLKITFGLKEHLNKRGRGRKRGKMAGEED